jgi:hypothetical protein
MVSVNGDRSFAHKVYGSPHETPKSATSVSQSAELAWNFPLKARLRQLWHADMQDQITRPRVAGTKFKLIAPDRAKTCDRIEGSWASLSATIISNGFRGSKLKPSAICIASSKLIAQLEKLSLLEGQCADESSDFEFIIEEAVV